MLAHESERIEQRPLLRGEQAKPYVDERVRIERDARRVAEQGAQPLAVRAAGLAEGRAEGDSKASDSSRAKLCGSSRQPPPSAGASSSVSGGLAASKKRRG